MTRAGLETCFRSCLLVDRHCAAIHQCGQVVHALLCVPFHAAASPMPSFRLSGVVSVNPGGLHHPHSLTTHHFRLPKAIRDARPPAYSACENLRLASVAGLYLSRPVVRRWSRYPMRMTEALAITLTSQCR